MAAYRLGVRRDFVAQHYLFGGDFGPEGELHSHHYRIEVVLEGETLDRHGFLVDIVPVERALEALVARYRDKTLNELEELSGLNPGIEVLARVSAEALGKNVPFERLSAIEVTIWESDDAWATHRMEH